MNVQHGIKGEVSGAYLLGIVKSFYDLNVLPECGLNLEQIDPIEWYPYPLLLNTMKAVEAAQPSESLLFQAGINFFRLWYEQGPGREMIFSSLDWVHLNDRSGGYNSVVRGGSRDEIGWCDMRFFNEEQGIAVYDNVTPLHGQLVLGLFYGGFLIFDDMEYVEVEETEPQPYQNNPLLSHSIITVNFRLKPCITGIDLDKKVDQLKFGETLTLSDSEVESLIWRYKGIRTAKAVSDAYNDQINSALARSVNTIRDLSITDGLTHIFNRRYFNEVFPKFINKAKRDNEYICFIILDIDFFKQYNDTYGHQKGDEVLELVAAEINKQLKRGNDYCFRLGGEEFGLIFHSKIKENALIFAEQVRRSIEALEIEHQSSTVSPYLTVSIGLVCERAIEIGSDQAIYKEADDLLYRAKQEGRNRVEAV